jgi:hypothetical protein
LNSVVGIPNVVILKNLHDLKLRCEFGYNVIISFLKPLPSAQKHEFKGTIGAAKDVTPLRHQCVGSKLLTAELGDRFDRKGAIRFSTPQQII